MKRVEKLHYDFSSYFYKRRCVSIWHKVDELSKLKPNNVLEVGPGPGLLKSIITCLGVEAKTLDLDPELVSNIVASATSIPCQDEAFGICYTFQDLEYLPFDQSKLEFRAMVGVSIKFVFNSLPDAKRLWRYSRHVLKSGKIMIYCRKLLYFPQNHIFIDSAIGK